MAHRNTIKAIPGALALGLFLLVAGCGSSDAPTSASPPTTDARINTHISGSVGDGPIVDARLRVFSKSGQLLLKTRSSNTADYEIDLKARGSDYPSPSRPIRARTWSPPERLISARLPLSSSPAIANSST